MRFHNVYIHVFVYFAALGTDYTAVIGEDLVFNQNDTRACYRVEINQDNICEIEPNPFEDFFSTLRYRSGEMPIIVNSTQIRILIDDTNEPECGK